MALLEHEQEAVKAEALAALRAALITGEGVAEALRWCWYRNPAFSGTLLTETVRTRFPLDCDVRDLTAFIARHRPHGSLGTVSFPAREAEALMRAALGEVALLDEVDPERFSGPEIGITLLEALLGEWRPGPDEVDGLLDRVEKTLQAAQELSPGLRLAEEDWFAAGMHESPFARWAEDEGQDGVWPGR